MPSLTPKDVFKISLVLTGATAVPASLAYIAWNYMTTLHLANLAQSRFNDFPQAGDFRVLLGLTMVPPALLVLKWAFRSEPEAASKESPAKRPSRRNSKRAEVQKPAD